LWNWMARSIHRKSTRNGQLPAGQRFQRNPLLGQRCAAADRRRGRGDMERMRSSRPSPQPLSALHSLRSPTGEGLKSKGPAT
jgi:hypothetical protein